MLDVNLKRNDAPIITANPKDVVGSSKAPMSTVSALPSDSAERKDIPLARGCLDYFPAALAAVAEVSRVGNEKHNPGQPLHWSKDKSNDHADCAARHLLEPFGIDTSYGEGKRILHSVAAAWRSLANAQTEIEELRKQGKWPLNAVR